MYYIIYYSLIGSAFSLSILLLKRGTSKFWTISALLAVTLFVELLAHLLIWMKINFVWAYHLYSPVEYALLALYIRSGIRTMLLQKIINTSIFLFALISLLISTFFYKFETMPGINIGIESILVFILCTYKLFNLEINDDRPIVFKTDFWVCTGLLMFFGVCTFFFGIYTPLFNLSIGDAFALFGIIVAPLNLLLYAFINIGLICSIQKKKYITPL